jgi:hypothetical protein
MIKIFIVTALFISTSQAAYRGSIEFTPREKQLHQESIQRLVTVSKNCLDRHERDHLDFYDQNCITVRNGFRGTSRTCLSLFYGDRRYSMRRGQVRSDGQRLEYLPDALQSAGFDPALASRLRSTSCVGLALQCLKEGFEATGQASQWERVMRFVRLNNVGGTSLQHGLQALGWKIYYWNPSPFETIDEDTKRWDEEEKNWQSKGWHNYRYITVRSRGTYWYNRVDNKWDMVGFRTTTPRILHQHPFWVGIAHTGYHVFPGSHGRVIEAHSTRHITSKDNLEFSSFNPMATGGGPRWSRTEKYRSGLIALPPL